MTKHTIIQTKVIEPTDLIEKEEDVWWKTQTGQKIPIKSMQTSHLFFSIRMLWNHFCPVEYRILPYKEYKINMSREYIVSRTHALLIELSTRDPMELTPQQRKEMTFMLLCRQKLKLERDIKKLP